MAEAASLPTRPFACPGCRRTLHVSAQVAPAPGESEPARASCRTPRLLRRKHCREPRRPRSDAPRRNEAVLCNRAASRPRRPVLDNPLFMSITCLITGATGFVGGHLAEACAGAAGRARPGAAQQRHSLLERQRRDAHPRRPDRPRRRPRGAARRRGRLPLRRQGRRLGAGRGVSRRQRRGACAACSMPAAGQPLQRFVHFSSLGVYAARHHHGTDENEPLPAQHIDGYTQTKVESEQLVLQLPARARRPGRGAAAGLHLRAARPHGDAELIENLRRRKVRYIGGGKRAMNCIYVGNLVEAALLAAGEAGSGRTDFQPDRRRVGVEAALHRSRRRRRGVCRGRRRWAVPLWAGPAAGGGGWKAGARTRAGPKRRV